MTAKPALTIGIPTYNFGDVIGQTLASIEAAKPEDIEILIVDGGSSDDTPRIVEQWAHRLPCIRYVRKETRDGIDVDMALLVELASAEYCWLLSADDLIQPSAIATVLACLHKHPDLVLLSHSNCDAEMCEIQRQHPVIAGETRSIVVDDATSRHLYFLQALTTEALFSFISGLVVSREAWNVDRGTSDLFYGSCWAHAARLLRRMRDVGLKIEFLNEPLVRRRGEHDSFAKRGLVSRYALGIEGYTMIVGQIFGSDGVEYRQTLQILRREFTLPMFMYAKQATGLDPKKESVGHLADLFYRLYPRRFRYALHHLGWSLPAEPFIFLFERLNKLRHRMLGAR